MSIHVKNEGLIGLQIVSRRVASGRGDIAGEIQVDIKQRFSGLIWRRDDPPSEECQAMRVIQSLSRSQEIGEPRAVLESMESIVREAIIDAEQRQLVQKVDQFTTAALTGEEIIAQRMLNIVRKVIQLWGDPQRTNEIRYLNHPTNQNVFMLRGPSINLRPHEVGMSVMVQKRIIDLSLLLPFVPIVQWSTERYLFVSDDNAMKRQEFIDEFDQNSAPITLQHIQLFRELEHTLQRFLSTQEKRRQQQRLGVRPV